MRGVRAETLHAIILMALIAGLAFSIWSAYDTLHPESSSICSVTNYVNCGKVALSGDTSIFGIPYWSIGIIGFVAMLAVDVPLYQTWRRELLVALTILATIGALAALYFLYQEVAVIGAICPICTGAHVCDFGVLGSSLALLLQTRSNDS